MAARAEQLEALQAQPDKALVAPGQQAMERGGNIDRTTSGFSFQGI